MSSYFGIPNRVISLFEKSREGAVMGVVERQENVSATVELVAGGIRRWP